MVDRISVEDHTPATRSFHWVSSVEGDAEVLRSLHEAMMDFYSETDQREDYQEMLDDIEEQPSQDSATVRLARYIADLGPSSMVEVGCGGGRLYRTLRHHGYQGAYAGIEVAEHVIGHNRERHSSPAWHVADAYNLPQETGSVDVVCAEFVLEHLVYPAEALREMMRVIRPGGQLVLVFPDFVSAGRLASQVLGLSPGPTAQDRLREGRILDAVVSMYDSRVRLPNALARAREEVGPFPVNLRPKCLTYPDMISSDVDAVYIASKEEVAEWALDHGYDIEFPWGADDQIFQETAHIAIAKQ